MGTYQNIRFRSEKPFFHTTKPLIFMPFIPDTVPFSLCEPLHPLQ